MTADVIDVNAQTPGLDSMLAKFNREHWHEEDEVRFIIHGHGLFHIRPKESPVVPIEVEAGDLILCPRGCGTGSISAPIDRFARSVCSKTLPVGHPIIPRAGSIEISNRRALDLRILLLKFDAHGDFQSFRSSVQGILLDIEGTTSPMDFVYQVLFPFVRVHLKDYLRHNADSKELQRDLSMLREEHVKDMEQGLAPPEWTDAHPDAQIESVARYVFWLMDRDRKSTGLKSLQGKIWQQGYATGELKKSSISRCTLLWNTGKIKISTSESFHRAACWRKDFSLRTRKSET